MRSRRTPLDVLNDLVYEETNPMLKAARKNELQREKVARRTIPGLAASQGITQNNYRRLYADFTLTASGNTLTCSPYDSKMISILADDVGWVDKTLEAAITLDTTGYVSNKQYDIFISWDNSTDLFVLSTTAWTSETARAATLQITDGIPLDVSDTTKRFIGVGRYNGSSLSVSTINPNGELFFGTGDPRNNTVNPYTGVGVSGPGVTFGSYVWQIFAALLGKVGVGFNNLGQLLAGMGAVILDITGISVKSTGLFFSFDNLSLTGGKEIGSMELIPASGLSMVSFTTIGALTVPNPGFELGTSWTYAGGAGESTDFAHSGSKSGKMPGGAAASIQSSAFINVAGKSVLLDFWFYCASAAVYNDLDFAIQCYTGGGAPTGNANSEFSFFGVPTPGQWTRIQVVGTYPASTAKVKLIFGAGISDLYIDDISLYDGTGYQIVTGLVGGAPGMVVEGGIRATQGLSGSNLSGTNTGDVTLAGTPNYITIAGQVITRALIALNHMADVATSTVFYRKTAGTGSPEVQTLATLKTDLGLTGTNTGDQTLRTPIFTSGLNNTVAGSSTNFIGMHAAAPNATETNVQAQAPFTGTLRNLRLRTTTAQPAGGNMVVTVRVGGSDTSMTFTISAGAAAGTFADVSNTAAVTAAQALSIKAVNNAAGASAQIAAVSLEYDAS
jgi:hypothetical protein